MTDRFIPVVYILYSCFHISYLYLFEKEKEKEKRGIVHTDIESAADDNLLLYWNTHSGSLVWFGASHEITPFLFANIKFLVRISFVNSFPLETTLGSTNSPVINSLY